MAKSTLPELKLELTPYVIKQELIDETNSERIGNGAYGVITKVKYCGTPCAFKELHSFLLPQHQQQHEAEGIRNVSHIIERFCKEIKLLSEIRHPNFVRFIGVYFRQSSPFPVLVMELMNTSVAECLKLYACDKQKFPLSTKLFILRDVSRALVYLHSQNPPIIHRDLTANNVLLTSNMMAKLADLGVAKIIEPNLSQLSTTQCPGTVVYMPPEALQEHPIYGTEIDVYSFGVLGFHIFSGKWPLYHGALTDPERCHADLIGEGFHLADTFKSCLDGNPSMRLSATNILAKIEGTITSYKMEECNFLEAQYCMRHEAVLLEEMNKVTVSQSEKLKSKEQHILELKTHERENMLVTEQLKGDNKDLRSNVKLLEEKNTKLAQQVEALQRVVASMEETMAVTLKSDFVKESGLPCQQCVIREKENKDLSNFIVLLQEKMTVLSNEIKIKNEEVVSKKAEIELKEDEIKNLNEKIKLLEIEADFKHNENIDTVFHTPSKELLERNNKLLETIETLNKQLVERNDKQKMVQEHYRSIIQDLLIPYKENCCSNLQCFTWEKIAEAKLKPLDKFTSEIQTIRELPGSSILNKVTPAVFHNGIIILLCNVQLKRNKKYCTGVTACVNVHIGEFSLVGDPEVQFVSIGHLGSKVLALKANKKFSLLTEFSWVDTSIPPLPTDILQDPVILTYQSLLLVINGNTVWVHDDSICNWLQFELSTPDGNLSISSKNSFVVVAGKLFVCSSLKKSVYFVELQEMIQLMIDISAVESTENMSHQKEKATVCKKVLQLNCILKDVNFIFLHDNNVIAIHTISTTPVSSTYIDRIKCYDVHCCHWHDVRSSLNSTDIVKGSWLTLFDDCAGVVEIPPVPSVLSWNSWGIAKLHKIQLRNN